jgi:hypothetical protein
MLKKKDGFAGQRLISLPITLLEREIAKNPFFNSLYITHIGYFPKATFYHRDAERDAKTIFLSIVWMEKVGMSQVAKNMLSNQTSTVSSPPPINICDMLQTKKTP